MSGLWVYEVSDDMCVNRKGERKEKGENRFKSVWGRLYIVLLRLVV